jgi:hypothetical protein
MIEKRNRNFSWTRRLGAAALFLQLTACGPSFNFVYMAKDSQGDEKTTRFFSVGDEIHCVMEMVGGGEDTVIVLELTGPGGISSPDDEYYPRPQGEQGPVFVDIQYFTQDAAGNRSDSGPWAVGDYEIDVYLDDSLEETLAFDVVDITAP